MSINASCAAISFASSGLGPSPAFVPASPPHRATASIRVATEARASRRRRRQDVRPVLRRRSMEAPESDASSIQRSLPATSASSTASRAASLTSPTA